ncbi:double-stranded RNA-binding protein Staufen homolog isoform X2 [Littorina saxatilis]|uniref:double-stranded RNA-binding protein Staufen homolog isoform X2 n=2 Tax=Littorina saxatilis TaxID=31220 RepID=UPI0038B4B727
MSQMLNQAGGQSQSAGYHGATQGHTTVPANTAGITSMPLQQASGKSGALGMSNSPHYGQLSSHQQQHHHMLQQFQQLQLGAQGAAVAGTPILGSSTGMTFRGVERRSVGSSASPIPSSSSSASSAKLAGGDSPPNGAVGLDLGGRGVAQAEMLKGGEGVISNNADSEEDEKETTNLANTKEKTPMCLVNELARYNKVAHQYTLVDEQGPAHKKTFFVKLKLGEEEYSAQGESIKKAQHAAADIALQETKFSHPVPKIPRHMEGEGMCDSVELNALAMKRGEPAVYKLIEPRNQQQNYQPANIDFRGMYNQRYHYGRPPRPFYVMLKVGHREFIGDGPTRQAARHSAASKALRVLKNMPLPSEDSKPKTEEEKDAEDAMKSEISLVHEIALKRNLPVAFEVTRESGPPHMKNFVTKCIVGDKATEAEGNSKKLSKKRAAELMLDELQKLPGPPTAAGLKPKIKPPNNKKKNRNLIKVQKADPSYGVGVNPISRLIQIMQAQKKKEPVYTLLAEKGLPRRREFVMQCQVEENVSEGVGPNKKLAKRNAAESMLQLLGFSRPSPQPTKPSIRSTPSTESGGGSDKKVTFVDTGKPAANGVNGEGPGMGNSAGCQVVPGLLRLNQSGAASVQKMMAPSPGHGFTGQKDVSSVLTKAGSKPEEQAVALSEYLGIAIKFEEFSKSNSTEFLTRVTLSTSPPQVYHGTGPSRESSRDAAALSALQTLLAATTNPHAHQVLTASGDAVTVKTEAGMNASLPRQLNSAGDQM